MVAVVDRTVSFFRRRAPAMFARASADNFARLRENAAFDDRPCLLLDLGSWTGESLEKYAPQGATVIGLEYDHEAGREAIDRGVLSIRSNLNGGFPCRPNMFDVVTSNQVIEHLADTDNFVAEILRVLKPGGWAVVSTENASSWHNIAALMMG